MNKLRRFIFLFLLASGMVYVARTAGLIDALTQAIQSVATQSPSPASTPIEPKQKAEIDLQIQQQYQKILSPQEHEQESLSEEERLKMLTNALSELDHAEDEYDREVAVMTLGELNDPLAKQGLLTALQDESNIVASQAIRQINKWPNPSERTEMLLNALRHHDDDIVLETLQVINVVDDPRLIARLKQLSKHPNPEIRDAADLALNLVE